MADVQYMLISLQLYNCVNLPKLLLTFCPKHVRFEPFLALHILEGESAPEK